MMTKLCEISMTRMNNSDLTKNNIVSLYCKLMNRILNTKISSLVKTYISNHLTRSNDVNFHPSIAVISESDRGEYFYIYCCGISAWIIVAKCAAS